MTEESSKTGIPGRPYLRLWNIAFRTVHICVSGVLAGGHVFGLAAERLLPWAYGVILTGAALMVIEVCSSRRYLIEWAGVMLLGKLLVLGLIPWFWDARVPLLITAIVIGSVGSHMPKSYRHYSVFR